MAMDVAGLFAPDPERRRFATGDLVGGRYRIERFIGAGGMGEVYGARDETLDVYVALKTLRGELARDEQALDAFRRELLVLRRVTHANVCRVFDYGVEGESAYFTMECVEGESLRERLTREGPFAPEAALGLVRQLAAGLAAAHDLGIVHRDFKSANILLDGAGRAVITDFGLARNVRSEQAEPQIGLGTPTYMAPEQMEERPAGPRADLYSFGVVLYELVTGVVPWTGATPVALALKKIREAPPKPSALKAGLPRRWDEVVLRCLAYRPEDRYGGAMEIVAALEPVRLGRRYVLASLGALALAAAGFVGWRWWEARPNTSAAAVAAMRAGAWHRAEGLLRRETTTDARARLAETLLELDRVEEAKDIVLSLPATARVEATKLLAQRRYAEAARAFAALPDGRVDGCRIQGKTQPEQALLCWDAVLRETPENGAAWLQSGLLVARQRKVAPALERLERAEAIFRAAGEVEGIAEARLGRAAALQHEKNWGESRRALEEALELARAARLDYTSARLQFALARNAIFAGDMGEAQARAEAGGALAKEKGFAFLAAQGRNDLGSLLLAQYKLEAARGEFTMARLYAKDARSAAQEARAELSLASVAMRQKRQAEALPLIRAGLAYYERGGYRDQALSAKFLLVDALTDTGELAEARRILAALRGDASLASDHVAQTRILERERIFALWARDFSEARQIQQSLIGLYGRSGEGQSLAYAWVNLAEVECRDGKSGEMALGRGRSLAQMKGAEAVLERAFLVEAGCALASGRGEAAARAGRAALAFGFGTPSRDALAWSAVGGRVGCEKAVGLARELDVRAQVLGRCVAVDGKWAGELAELEGKLRGDLR
jgi:tetratricopeptide (TPR) repeat protein